jgi:hypothetical protein
VERVEFAVEVTGAIVADAVGLAVRVGLAVALLGAAVAVDVIGATFADDVGLAVMVGLAVALLGAVVAVADALMGATVADAAAAGSTLIVCAEAQICAMAMLIAVKVLFIIDLLVGKVGRAAFGFFIPITALKVFERKWTDVLIGAILRTQFSPDPLETLVVHVTHEPMPQGIRDGLVAQRDVPRSIPR